MAQIATMTEVPVETFDFIAPLPFNKLVDPFVISTPPNGWSSVITNRFPTPPKAVAFLGFLDSELQDPMGLTPPYLIIGAVYPETKYLEPTLGQIWPRIG